MTAARVEHRPIPSIGRPLTIMHVTLRLDPGGLERIVVDLIREGLALGQQPISVCLERPGTLAGDVEQLGVPVIGVGKKPGLRFEIIPALCRTLRGFRPDVVHTHQVAALLYAGPAARLAGVPLVVHTEHGDLVARQQSGPARIRARGLLAAAGLSAARVFCVAEHVAKSVSAFGVIPARKLIVVPNGIDLGRFDRVHDAGEIRRDIGISATDLLVGSVGRLSEVKRYDMLLRAFADLRAARPNVHLALVGDGPEGGSLRAFAGSLGLADCVHFAGYCAEPAPYFKAFDVFALTSRSEGMPLAILEAWGAGVPIIASNVGGIPRLVTHGEDGLLYEFGDHDALVRGLSTLIEDRARAIAIAARGNELVRTRYGLRTMAQTYERHYRALLDQGRVPST